VEGGSGLAAYEFVLQRPHRPDKICYGNRDDAEVGDVVVLDGKPWLVVEKQPPFARRRIERIVCVPRKVPGY
jgi:hypothetical protein